MKVNWTRGLFRLWLVLSLLFSVAVFATAFEEIKKEFARAYWVASAEDKYKLLVPVECEIARGTEGTDFDRHAPSSPSTVKSDRCWYDIPTFRSLYPEYSDLNDDTLASRLYGKIGIIQESAEPWLRIAKYAGIAFGIPALVLVIGSALCWAISGFKQSTNRSE